jgi:hypothetical protein
MAREKLCEVNLTLQNLEVGRPTRMSNVEIPDRIILRVAASTPARKADVIEGGRADQAFAGRNCSIG